MVTKSTPLGVQPDLFQICLAMVDSNSHPRSEFLLQNSVHILDPVRLADQVDAVEEGEELFSPTFNLPLTAGKVRC